LYLLILYQGSGEGFITPADTEKMELKKIKNLKKYRINILALAKCGIISYPTAATIL